MASGVLIFDHGIDNKGVHVLHNYSPVPSCIPHARRLRLRLYSNILFIFSITYLIQRNQQIGANAGIGLALTKQLVADYGCHVYLGSRDAVRGANAVDEVKTFSAGKGGGSVELLTIVSVVSSSRTLEQFVVLAGRWMILSRHPYRDSW